MHHKVLFIIDSDGVGGVEKRFSNLFKHLADLNSSDINKDVTFLVNKKLEKKINNYKTQINNNKLKLLLFGTTIKIPFVNKIISRFTELLSIIFYSILFKLNFDTVVFVTTRSLRYLPLIKARNKILVVYAYTINPDLKMFEKYGRLAQRGFLFDCLSEDIANILSTNNFIKANQVFVTPNSFIDFSNTEVKYEEKKNIVTFLARFDKKKGTDLLLDTIDCVLKERNDIHFQVIGYGPEKNTIINHINKNNYGLFVSIIFSEEPKKQLKLSKVFLSIQLKENYPSQALLEAMACKNAIVATDVGLTYKLVDNENGLRVNPKGTDIAKAIIYLYNNPKQMEKKGFNAREKILQNCTAENYFKYITSILINR